MKAVEFSLHSAEIKRVLEQSKIALQRAVEKENVCFPRLGKRVLMLQAQGKRVLSKLNALLRRNFGLPVTSLPEEMKNRIKQSPFQAETAFPHKSSALGGSWISSEDFAVVVDLVQKTVKTYSNEAL